MKATRDPATLLREFVAELAARDPPVRIVEKRDVWHQRLAARLLYAVTLGGQRTYLSHYVTTLGHTIFVPEDWSAWAPDEAYRVLRHELVHVRQFERYGIVAMTLLYGIFPLPAGLAYGRARLEWEAYAETLRVAAELGGAPAAADPALHAHIVKRFTGPDYAWMWPFPRTVQGWIDAEVAAIVRHHERGGD